VGSLPEAEAALTAGACEGLASALFLGSLAVSQRWGLGDAYASSPSPIGLAAAAPPSALALSFSDQVGDRGDSPPPFLASCTALPPLHPDGKAVLDAAHDVCNKVAQKEAKATLLRLKAEKQDLFASAALYARVHAMLARYNISLPVRRFIHNLFDRVSFNEKSWSSLSK